jgi:hypothetical protein
VSAERGQSTFDRDLDSMQPSRARRRLEPIAESQRLLVNPLLAVLCGLGACYIIAQSLRIRVFELLAFGTALFCVSTLLIQYHCLDCGATGLLVRSRHHACPLVIARQERPGSWQRRGPRVGAQLLIWLYILTVVAVLSALAYYSR